MVKIVLAIAAIAFAGQPVSSEVLISKADSGKEIAVKKFSQVKLELPSNPTTGYSWYFSGR
ncbi:MAG: protease inhibitor I42 family protein, partial [Elusimicrobia bacterium]|nr:protease inhibitor I42 family protein [Elusimicrobiota bacterium]